MPPTFSIIIPVYNVAAYLRECLDSVLAQTFGDWEAVCVDDGSTDGSGAILDEYAAKDVRFKVVHQANAGVSAARNSGMANASGEYITYLDGDDAYDRAWLAEASNVIAETGADIVRMRYTDFHDKPPTAEFIRDYAVHEGPDAVRKWGFREFSEKGYSFLVFMKRDRLPMSGGHGFPVGMGFMEDNVFMLRNVPSFHKAVQSEFAGYYYRVRENSACRGLMTADSVDRVLKEAASLYDGYGPDMADGVVEMLQTAVFSWVGRGDRKRAGADRSVADMVSRMHKGGYFSMKRIARRWRLGYEAIVRLRSFRVMDALCALQRLWGRVRASCLAMAKS